MHERMRTRRKSWAYIRMSRHAAQYFRPRSSMTRSTSFTHHFQQLLDSRASNHNKDSEPSRKHVVDVVCTMATPAQQTQLRLAARRRRGCRAGYRESSSRNGRFCCARLTDAHKGQPFDFQKKVVVVEDGVLKVTSGPI